MSQESDRGLQTAMTGAGTGAGIGTAIYPGIGTAIGAVVGGVAGYIVGSQPIPTDHVYQTEEVIYDNLSQSSQYSYNEEVTGQLKTLRTRIDLADPDSQTKDFETIMGIGSTLANIYSSAGGPSIGSGGSNAMDAEFNVLNNFDMIPQDTNFV